MPTYDVAGTGRDTGRKRRRQYHATDEAHARQLAEADGTVVATITELPPPPPQRPTERQLAYADQLGITVPADATLQDVSDLIDAKLARDKPPSQLYRDFARRHGVEFTEHTGKKALFDRIFARLSRDGSEEDLAAWFAYRVYRNLVSGRYDVNIQTPADPIIRAVGVALAQDAQVMKSIRWYQHGSALIWFGEFVAPDGAVHRGGSNVTIAYRRAAALLHERVRDEITPGRDRPGERSERPDGLHVMALTPPHCGAPSPTRVGDGRAAEPPAERVACRECTAPVAADAVTCRCGAIMPGVQRPAPRAIAPKSRARGWAAFLVIPFLVLGLAYVVTRVDSRGQESSSSRAERWDYVPAYVICQEAVTARLRAPATAKFAFPPEMASHDAAAGTAFIAAHVDAQNSFGALLRTRFGCEMRGNGRDWRVEKVVIERRD